MFQRLFNFFVEIQILGLKFSFEIHEMALLVLIVIIIVTIYFPKKIRNMPFILMQIFKAQYWVSSIYLRADLKIISFVTKTERHQP